MKALCVYCMEEWPRLNRIYLYDDEPHVPCQSKEHAHLKPGAATKYADRRVLPDTGREYGGAVA